jgi:acetyl esterase/lipase
LDAKRAIRYIRYNAKKYGYDENKIGILGFSAGGHLACNTSNSYDEETEEFEIGDEIDKINAKVNFSILCYPVISYSDFAHVGSFKNLCGDDDKLKFSLSLENRVTKNTPPTFIWATADDGSVPSKNTIIYTQNLFENGISYESHIFRSGKHGLGLANKGLNDIPEVAIWTKLCENWMNAFDLI